MLTSLSFSAIRKKNAHAAKIKKDRLLAVLDQTRGGGGSSTKIKKLLKQLGSEQCSLGVQSPQPKSKNDDSGTVKTEQSIATFDGSPPDIPASLLMRMQKDVSQSDMSPYATQHFEMDDAIGLKNLRLKE